jgi:hypothetical protein
LEKDMNLLAKIGLLGLLAGGTASALYADPAGGWLSPNGVSGAGPASASAAAQPGTTSATGTVTVALPAVEIQARVQVFLEQTRADARHIMHLQQIARKEKDVIKLNCVNDKLVQVKPELNIIDNGVSELESATDANRMTVFEGIAAAAENIRHLREEADQCIGEPVQTGGDSSNSFTGPDMPDDPTKGFSGPELEPPGYASPYN